MFDPTCTGCGQQVLLGTRRLEGLQNTDEGIVLVFRCHCGSPALLLTGSRRHEDEALATAG